MSVLRYMDVVLIVVAAPILLLIGVPASGYCVGAGAWIVLRASASASSAARAAPRATRAGRSGCGSATCSGACSCSRWRSIFVRRGDGRDAGLTALLVIVFAFTVELIVSIATRADGAR